MEIADVLVVNKADLAGADALIAQLKALLSISEHGDWLIPIVKVVASRGDGVPDLIDAIARHRDFLESSGRLEKDRRRSEEHTSELQSRQYLVCRLLLEKKKY